MDIGRLTLLLKRSYEKGKYPHTIQRLFPHGSSESRGWGSVLETVWVEIKGEANRSRIVAVYYRLLDQMGELTMGS